MVPLVVIAEPAQGKESIDFTPQPGCAIAHHGKVRQHPGLTHDDPYGEGWIFEITPESPDAVGTLLSAADYRLDHEIPNWTKRQAWGNHLRLLTGDIEQSRLQSTAALIMRKYLDYLNPGSRSRPSPTFNAYTRSWLIRYVNFHPRERGHAVITAVPQTPHFRPTLSMARRIALTVAMLALALVVTGTAQAQSALPGDPLYAWKRTSEQAMLSLSPDPLGTEQFATHQVPLTEAPTSKAAPF